MSQDLLTLIERVWELICECLAGLLSGPSLLGLGRAEIVAVGDRRFRVIRQLGEGGYAFVHLVRELPTPQRPLVEDEPLALKRVFAASGERLRDAQREIETTRALAHPNCLPLLAHAAADAGAPGAGGGGGGARGQGQGQGQGGGGRTVSMLFPAFEDGTLAEEVARLAAAGRRLGTADVLDIFEQVVAAVAHMHGRGLAHRDVKPHNVLIVRPEHNAPRGGTSLFDGSGDEGGGSDLSDADAAELGQPPDGRGGSSSPRRRQPPPPQQQQQLQPQPQRPQQGHEGGGSAPPPPPPPPRRPADGRPRRPRGRRRRRYGAVLMDFGSARPAAAAVTTRLEALALQEDAEAHCTATYRAPELFDVATYSTLDGRVDVWSLGCTLYHMMYGASPFQAALDRGASLPLAVMSCRIPWPQPPAPRYPPELHELVNACLATDPAARPAAGELLARARALRRRALPEPGPGLHGAR
ncbi:serine threonine kinase [Raphidocelis subcapitata]|uniref:non-specific serine/threonine protein kinase n=1 Tax=Raphidocelis subcapitata TaxID=307507 RepID=A0A2V0PML0_9CHLO|nr:serine threonine kinase [Raphidocelis subcapitata]|eukprot:GBF99323.1 serine threonine kinase [Raphidocelis subcapitata]